VLDREQRVEQRGRHTAPDAEAEGSVVTPPAPGSLPGSPGQVPPLTSTQHPAGSPTLAPRKCLVRRSYVSENTLSISVPQAPSSTATWLIARPGQTMVTARARNPAVTATTRSSVAPTPLPRPVAPRADERVQGSSLNQRAACANILLSNNQL
jgi:hypothetical protein